MLGFIMAFHEKKRDLKEMSQLSGVSVRTLHYYDEINLLTPSFVADNGYRYDDNAAFEKLQEILLFRELEFPLKDIKKIVGNAAYDRDAALKDQIQFLELKKQHLEKSSSMLSPCSRKRIITWIFKHLTRQIC